MQERNSTHEEHMKKIIAVCSALALSAAVTIHAQQVWVTTAPDQQRNKASWTMMPLEARVVKGMPYSAEIVTDSVQTLADGNRIVQRRTGRVYRDGEGRVRREEDRPTGGPTVSITDPVAGTSFTLDPANRVARATPSIAGYNLTLNLTKLAGQLDALGGAGRTSGTLDLSSYQAPPPTWEFRGRGGRGGPGGESQSEEKLPDRVIEGVLASGVRRTTTIEKGAIGNEQPIKIVSEEWTSPELQILVMTDFTDPRTGRSTYRLLKISRLAPDQALFQVPPDYTVQRGRGVSPAPAAAGGRGRGRGQS